MSLTLAPVRPFQRVLEAVATRMGWDPGRIQANQAAALTAYVNTAMETVWNFLDWPEIMRSELLPATDGVIPWQAAPVTTREATLEVTTNGYFLTSMTGWTIPSGLFTYDGGAAFSIASIDAALALEGIRQTISGLTVGQTYRIGYQIDNMATAAGTLGYVKFKADFGIYSNYITGQLSEDTSGTFEFVAPATSVILSMEIYPIEADVMEGRLRQLSLHATTLIRTAPRPAIDCVRGVFTTDPFDTPANELQRIPFRLGPGCLHLRGSEGTGASEAWVYYRPACPRFTSAAYSAGTVYQAGGLNELAYDTTTGHVFRALSLDAFSAIALTNAAYWEQTGVPDRFAEALGQLARAEALDEQDQFGKAAMVRARAMDLLENAALTHLRQSGQTRNYRTAAPILTAA